MLSFHGCLPVNIVVFAFAAFLPWTTFAAEDRRVPLTLAEAEDLALSGEPGTAALLARADAMREHAAAAEVLPDPSLRVGLANFPLNGGGFSTEGMSQAQFGIRQAFPRGRASDGRASRARAAALSSSAGARGREVLSSVRQAWLDAYYSQQAWRLVNESRPFFEDLVTITRSMYSVGRKSQHDVLRAELELSRLDDRIIEIGRARAEARAALSRWIGAVARRPVARKLPAWNDPPPLVELHSGLGYHPAVAAANAEVAARHAAVKGAEEKRKPGWALDFGYGYREGFLPDGSPRSDFVSLSVSVDLPSFGENPRDRRLAAALSEQRAAAESRADLLVRLASELDAEYARWTDLTRRLALYETRILDQSRGQARAALLAYQSDAGDFSDVMRGHIDDLNTRLDHVRLQVERAKSHAVLANLGGLEQ